MLTDTIFEANETLLFDDISGLDQFPTNIFSTPNGITEVPFTFEKNSTITAFDKSDLTKQYTNVISGKVVLWDDRKKELRIANNKNPINNNESALATTSPYARVSFVGNTSAQVPDVFRVGDLLSYDNLASSERSFAEIKSITLVRIEESIAFIAMFKFLITAGSSILFPSGPIGIISASASACLGANSFNSLLNSSGFIFYVIFALLFPAFFYLVWQLLAELLLLLIELL